MRWAVKFESRGLGLGNSFSKNRRKNGENQFATTNRCEKRCWRTWHTFLHSGMATPVNVSVPLLSLCVHLEMHCLPWKGNPACSVITTLLPWNSEVSDFAACETKGSFAASQNKIAVVTFPLHQCAWHFRVWLRRPFVNGRERGSLCSSVIGSFYFHNSFCYLIHVTYA